MGPEKKIVRNEVLIVVFVLLIFVAWQIISGLIPQDPSRSSWDEVDDLNGKRFVFISGSAYIPLVEELFPDAEFLYVQDWVDQDIFVSQGKADALVSEYSSAVQIIEEYDNLTIFGDSIGALECRFGFPKNDQGASLAREMNVFLQMLREDGSLDEMWQTWEYPDKAPDHVEPPALSGPSRGALHIGTTLDWPPMCYLNGDEPCGFFIEIMNRFCEWANYDYVLEDVSVDSLLAGISLARYDFGCYGLVENSETVDNMNFSDVIYEEPVYLVVNKANVAGAAGADESSENESVLDVAERLKDDLLSSFRKTFITESRWKDMGIGFIVTIGLSLFSGVFGTLLGILICYLRISRNAWATAFARIYIKTIQGVPITVLLMILFYIIFAHSPITAFWVSVIGFSMDFSAYTSEIFRSGIESVPKGQIKAAMALGFSSKRAFWNIVVPQAVIVILPVYIGQFISMVKLTSIAGYISVRDLTKVSDIIRSRTYEAFFPLIVTALLYFLIAWLMTLALKMWNNKIDPATRKRVVKGVSMHD